MEDQGHQAMWPQMIAALAAIDEALGLPADGCNSTAQTLAAIKKLKEDREAFQESLYAELDTNFRLRDLGGARTDESMTPFIERVISERDNLRAWAEEAVNYVGCETWSPSLKEEGEALLLALRPNVALSGPRL